jgi:hypothetical protein
MTMRRIRQDKTWSAALVILLAIGVSTWLIIPSINASLQDGFFKYGESGSTYITASYSLGEVISGPRLSENSIAQIAAIRGVEEMYPVVLNDTVFPFISSMGGRNVTTNFHEDTAVIGGSKGYPLNLLNLASGKMPGDEEASFLFHQADGIITPGKTYTTQFAVSVNATGHKEYLKFNATAVGVSSLNRLISRAYVLWNSTFLQHKLGDQLYEKTFGGQGANYLIIRARDIFQVKSVVSEVRSIVNPVGYSVFYDEVTVDAQQSFQTQTMVLYNIVGAISLLSVVLMIFIFTYVLSGRRRWEAGLLVTQGWNWKRVFALFSQYYLILGFIAAVVSVPVSMLVAGQFGFSFTSVAANEKTITLGVSISPYLLASGVVISLVVSFAAAGFAVWRMKKMGLDNLLRDY